MLQVQNHSAENKNAVSQVLASPNDQSAHHAVAFEKLAELFTVLPLIMAKYHKSHYANS